VCKRLTIMCCASSVQALPAMCLAWLGTSPAADIHLPRSSAAPSPAMVPSQQHAGCLRVSPAVIWSCQRVCTQARSCCQQPQQCSVLCFQQQQEVHLPTAACLHAGHHHTALIASTSYHNRSSGLQQCSQNPSDQQLLVLLRRVCRPPLQWASCPAAAGPH
jgi:hypothetical protein